jgi:hypothetical protein
MAWYWLLLLVLLIFNVGFVCGAWLCSPTNKNVHDELRVERLSV